MKTYNSYHTCIKQPAKRNSVPQSYLGYIDRTTIWRWRQEPADKYLGTELTSIDLLEKFLARKESESIIRTYLKVAYALSGILSASDQLHKLIKMKLIAQKDIPFSNSIIEAQNKLIKYRYLFKQDFRDIHELRKGLEWIIFDYNHNRPHISLKGLTPYEAATGENVPKIRWHEQIHQARKSRFEENRKELCKICR